MSDATEKEIVTSPVGFYVPTRGHVWHGTAAQLAYIGIVNEIGLPIYVRGVTGTAEVRNEIVQHFLASEKEVLLMVDDDVVPPRHLTQIVDHVLSGDTDICAAAVPIIRPDTVFMPNIFNRNGDGYDIALDAYQGEGLTYVDAVGTGAIAISRRVLDHHTLRHPFRAKISKHGVWERGEDITFCERARSQGFRVAVDLNVWCEHLTEVHANGVAMSYMRMLMEVEEASVGDESTEPEPGQDLHLREVSGRHADEGEGVRPAGGDLREGVLPKLPDLPSRGGVVDAGGVAQDQAGLGEDVPGGQGT